jgi:hypothetical protein
VLLFALPGEAKSPECINLRTTSTSVRFGFSFVVFIIITVVIDLFGWFVGRRLVSLCLLLVTTIVLQLLDERFKTNH